MTTIIIKNSSTSSAVPVSGDLTKGELAVNVTDKKLYTKDNGGSVVKLVGGLGNQEANAVAITGGAIDGTPIGATTASTASFTTLSASGNVTLSGGTANGVLYLNGSKVATSGSALTFDGTNFGTTGNANLGSASKSTDTQINLLADTGTQRIYIERGSRSLVFYDVGAAIENYRIAGITGVQSWGVGGSEAMRLTSTGLGIGTSSPSQKLTVAGGIASTTGISALAASTAFFDFNSGSARFAAVSGSTGTAASILFSQYSSNGSVGRDAMTLDSSGNLGLGVTPSAWGSAYKSLEVNGAVIQASSSNKSQAGFGNNYYHNGTNYIYSTSNYATSYFQNSGAHTWYTAASGTAGDAITFTQAMTLDASGNLGIGSTSPQSILELKNASPTITINGTTNNAARGLIFQSSGTQFGRLTANFSTGEMRFLNGESGQTGYYMTFFTDSTERARIDSSGNFLINDTGSVVTTGVLRVKETGSNYIARLQSTGASAPQGLSIYYSGAAPNGTGSQFLYCEDSGTLRMSVRSNGGIANYQANDANLSDRREKMDFAPAGNYLAKICAIPVQTFKYIDQTDDESTLGVVAQDVQAVAPELVMESNWAKEGDEPKMRLSIYQTDLQYALMKALQELKAEFDAYKASHP